MKKQVFRTSSIERWGFAFFMAGQAIINTFVGSFLHIYLTDIGVTAVAVGMLFLIARVWDAVNDPIFGVVVEKTNMGSGKFLPWLRVSNVLLPLSTILLFMIPSGIPLWGKVTLAFLGYFLYDIAYTICDVPIFAMTSAVTDQVHERIAIISRNTVISSITIILVSVFAPESYKRFGAFTTALILSLIALVLMFFISRFAKERYINKDEEEVTLKGMIRYIKDNKYLRIIFAAVMTLSITNMTTTLLNYFAIVNLGDIGKAGVVLVYIAVPALMIAMVMPLLMKKFDKFHMLMVGIIGGIIVSAVSYFIGYENFTLFSIVMIIRGFFYGLQLLLQISFTGDVVEYGEYVTGKRLQGTAYSIQTFIFKLMNAVPAAFAMFLLGWFGFTEGKGAVQTPEVTKLIWLLFTVSMIAGALLSLPIFAKYKLRDKTVQIMAMANSNEITKEEAEAMIKGKY